jgi:N4-(beta-N-acetylglucosaminyl)-L-asparaginase
MNRRDFVATSAAGIAAATFSPKAEAKAGEATNPAVIASANGLRATEKAMQLIGNGSDVLDAVVEGVNLVEEDPEETSVGYGGLPNEEGVVQLDASVMHGPTRGAGAVAALERIKTPSSVAKLVMEYTDHVLLVGEGALKFAVAMGFQQEDLLTEPARERWLQWKRELNSRDDWINPEDRLPKALSSDERTAFQKMLGTHGTINCNAVNEQGELAGVTTTSGMAFKISGRVGDSPIIGAGLYVDNDVGACGSTGRGEANIKTCASFMVVEYMRQGLSPEAAGLRVLERVARNTTEPYLTDDRGRPNFNLIFYAIDKQGRFAGTSMKRGSHYAAHSREVNQLYPTAYLYED